LFEGNVELRYPIISIFSGVIFYDFANVWPPSYDYRFGDLRYAAGMGLRVRTPIGPVRADVARPVFDEETTIQFHISVGQAF
jgi:outer membrane protein insertion porin family